MPSNSSTPGGGFRAARRCSPLLSSSPHSSPPPRPTHSLTPDPFAGVSLPGRPTTRRSPPNSRRRPGRTSEPASSRSQTAYAASPTPRRSPSFEASTTRSSRPSRSRSSTRPRGTRSVRGPFTAVIGDELPAENASDDPECRLFDPGQAPLLAGRGRPQRARREHRADGGARARRPRGCRRRPRPGRDSFTVENAAVEPEIPAELERRDRARRGRATVTPESTDGADAVPVADKLFYPSSDTDTDTLITPTPTGVEIFFQLRSPDAPTANAIDVTFPTGATLVATGRRRSRGHRRRRDSDRDPAGERLGRGAAADSRPLRGRRRASSRCRRDRRRLDPVAGRRRPDHRLLPVGRDRARARTRT